MYIHTYIYKHLYAHMRCLWQLALENAKSLKWHLFKFWQEFGEICFYEINKKNGNVYEQCRVAKLELRLLITEQVPNY